MAPLGENGRLFRPPVAQAAPAGDSVMPSRRERANAIRALSMDAVQKANSGHPGAPMGMADIAEVLWRYYLKHNPNHPHFPPSAFLGGGGRGEGISHEVCALAGTLGLGKLIAFYDDNGISIDGEVEGWFTDDTPKRFEAYGWQGIRNVDGHEI